MKTGAPVIDVVKQSARVAVVAAQWHHQIMDALIAGAVRAAEEAQVDAELFRVPGSFELPVVAQAAATQFDAVVALGVVIRGETPHFDYVCSAVTDGLNRVSLDARVPVGFGLLTCDTEQQAIDRAGGPGAAEDKGHEAMTAALNTLAVLKNM